jgi:hypothetical protein
MGLDGIRNEGVLYEDRSFPVVFVQLIANEVHDEVTALTFLQVEEVPGVIEGISSHTFSAAKAPYPALLFQDNVRDTCPGKSVTGGKASEPGTNYDHRAVRSS